MSRSDKVNFRLDYDLGTLGQSTGPERGIGTGRERKLLSYEVTVKKSDPPSLLPSSIYYFSFSKKRSLVTDF